MSVLGTSNLFGIPAPKPMRRFTVDEYHRMIDTGVLTENDPVELLEGWIVAKMASNALHDGTIQVVDKRLGRRLPAGWEIRIQSAITTPDSEPEPDLAVVRGDETTYLRRKPEPPDIGTLIEVSDSTLADDRQVKGRLYARANVLVYWIVNLIDRQVEVYTDPDASANPPAYRNRIDYRAGDQIPLVLDGHTATTIPAADLLP